MCPFVLICVVIDLLEVHTMNLTKAGSKNCPTYYIQKSIRVENKTSTKTIVRLGSIEEIKARCGDQDPMQYGNRNH